MECYYLCVSDKLARGKPVRINSDCQPDWIKTHRGYHWSVLHSEFLPDSVSGEGNQGWRSILNVSSTIPWTWAPGWVKKKVSSMEEPLSSASGSTQIWASSLSLWGRTGSFYQSDMLDNMDYMPQAMNQTNPFSLKWILVRNLYNNEKSN